MTDEKKLVWVRACRTEAILPDSGGAYRHGEQQIAIFRFASGDAWYAIDNRCPHMNDQVLARGLLGDENGIPKVACPQHKRVFSLETGESLSGDGSCVRAFAVKIVAEWVWLSLPALRDEDNSNAEPISQDEPPAAESSEALSFSANAAPVCPNAECADFNKAAAGNIRISMRYGRDNDRLLMLCQTCQQRFSNRRGSPLFRSRLSDTTVQKIFAYLQDGCSMRRISELVGVSRRTVARYRELLRLKAVGNR